MSAAPQVKDTLKFDIEIVKGPHIGFKATFTKASVSIGRGPENDIVLSGDPRASRQHAEIKQRGNEFVIVNLSQKNFILVNSQNVQSEILNNESVVQIGDTEIRFHMEMPTPAPTPAAPTASMPAAAPTPSPISSSILKPQMPQPMPAQTPAFQQPRPMQTPTMNQGGLPSMPSASMPPAQPMQYGGYQPPPSGPTPTMGVPRGASSGGGLMQNPKARFYGIVAIVALVGWFLLSPSKNGEKKDPNAFRTSAISMQDVADAEKRSQELLTIKKEKYDSVQYRRAQENFIKGFRDFQQGQYARAREAFQVVLNLDPENELAKRYYHLAKIKFDELVKFNMIQGNRYREKKNWRMCQSNYSNVMTMLANRKDDPSYKEAKQFFEECTLNLEGRF
ncbi:FHA domain-containing protein [Bdellovibrio sp. 22V]|uniref:FHA domain-containing protein n=1 Tax=Bdellovibrio TaxID=958 RepID=UPI0025430FFE|nr:FHA domain-containing protein [Bdellovibrio sp. 22V]WII70627.1 FHA domain-containing protein [Bdellovibrio sp. 22V]